MWPDNNVAIVQAALNYFLPSSPLVVDGHFGPATQARLREFQQLFGLPVTGQADPLTLQVLGISGAVSPTSSGTGPWADVTAGVSGDELPDANSESTWGLIWDALTLQGAPQAARNISQAINTAGTAALAPGQWTFETAKAAANAGGAAAQAAMKWLADNGDLLAKLALALGVGYGTALAIAFGGSAIVLILFLKKN